MSEELRENLAASLQKLLPLLTSIILVLMSYVPLNFAAANNLRPAVGLMCVIKPSDNHQQQKKLSQRHNQRTPD